MSRLCPSVNGCRRLSLGITNTMPFRVTPIGFVFGQRLRRLWRLSRSHASPYGLIDSLEVVCSLLAGIILTEEVIRLRRLAWLGGAEIVNANLETFRKTQNRFVS